MSTAQNPNTMLLGAALLVGAYLYSKRQPMQYAPMRQAGAVPTMPASAGIGTNQSLGQAALGGFLNAIAGGVGQSANRWLSGGGVPAVTGALQDVAYDPYAEMDQYEFLGGMY